MPSGDLQFQSTVQNRLAAVPTTLQEVVIIHVNIQKDQHSLGLSIIGGKVSQHTISACACGSRSLILTTILVSFVLARQIGPDQRRFDRVIGVTNQ